MTLSDWLGHIARARCVVTDRAHVLLAARLLGRGVTFTDGNNGKVTAIARYTFGDRPGRHLRFVAPTAWSAETSC
jgi:hypothetical protein